MILRIHKTKNCPQADYLTAKKFVYKWFHSCTNRSITSRKQREEVDSNLQNSLQVIFGTVLE